MTTLQSHKICTVCNHARMMKDCGHVLNMNCSLMKQLYLTLQLRGTTRDGLPQLWESWKDENWGWVQNHLSIVLHF